ncbi:MAG: GxxExxY protein, partial [Planctomycetes bacterium]|nr:GxxExxY protein [Planctomycetota bacterium]
FDIRKQVPLKVKYKGEIVGDYLADLVVNDQIILEIKAIRRINPIHETQLVNYLTATRIDLGLLINFGTSVEIRRKYREYSPKIM